MEDWRKYSRAGLLFGLLAIAAFLIYLPSELGMSLAIPPDSNEYAIGLSNLFTHGKFGFTLNGEWYPSRYAPWFSLFCLSPAYFLCGGDVLSLHWAVLAFALAFLVLSYRFCRIIGLGRWSYVCAALPMFIPDFVFYSRMVMTEIPYAALLATSALVFVRFADDEKPSLRFCVGAGVLVAWTGAVRFTALPMLALFAVAQLLKRCSLKRKVVAVWVLSMPVFLYLVANSIYNKCVFGSFFRNGYNYWVSVPCDYLDLTFNLKYAVNNSLTYLKEPVTLVLLILSIIVFIVSIEMIMGRFGGVRKNRSFLLLSGYVLFQELILIFVYIGYYWCDVRFFLPSLLCLLPLFVKALAAVFGMFRIPISIVATVIVVLCVGLFRFTVPRYYFMATGYPFFIAEAGITREVLPDGAVVVQDCNPLFVDSMGRSGKTIRHVPMFRRFDYVNTMVASTSIAKAVPRPTYWRQRIVPEFIASGLCRLPFPAVFSQDPDLIKLYIREGNRVFLHEDVSPGYRRYWRLDDVRGMLDGIGLSLNEFGAWLIPEISANPIRHVYDRFLFPSFSMDKRPELRCVYYEIVTKE